MRENLKILYVGPLPHGSTALQRMETLKELGHSLTPVNSAPNWVMKLRRPPMYYRIIYKLIGPPDLTQVNKRIIRFIDQDGFDLVWLDKGLMIKPETLRKVKDSSPRTIIVGYSPDDMGSKHIQSKKFLAGLPYYDLYCTTKTYNVQELKDLGCPRVMFIGNAYDPKTHRQMAVSPEERREFGGPVGFIGAYEDERAESIFFLAQRGIPVRVWGPNWKEKCKFIHPNLKIEGKPLWEEDYARGICSFDINLGFLRKRNRDLQTTRSVEVPACGAFMLAERTGEHLSLFEEGKEAEFFGSDAELLEKVRYYLAHEAERKQIARAGRERCLRSGYSYQQRLAEILLRLYEV